SCCPKPRWTTSSSATGSTCSRGGTASCSAGRSSTASGARTSTRRRGSGSSPAIARCSEGCGRGGAMRPGSRGVAVPTVLATIAASGPARAAEPARALSLVKMPYRGERNLPDLSDSPDYLEKGGIQKLLEQKGCRVKPPTTVALDPEDHKAYGEWNRLGLA